MASHTIITSSLLPILVISLFVDSSDLPDSTKEVEREGEREERVCKQLLVHTYVTRDALSLC